MASPKIKKLHKGLQEVLAAVKGIRKYISSIEIQNPTMFSNTVKLENALTYEMTTPQVS